MKKFIFIFLNLFIYSFATTINITPPNFSNASNYSNSSTVNTTSNTSDNNTVANTILNTNNTNTNTANNNKINNATNNTNLINNNINSINNTNSINNNTNSTNNVKTITTYKNTVYSDVLGKDNKNLNNCDIFNKSIYSISYEKGYEIGKKNSKYEIETKFKKLKSQLDIIFPIKNYYIENILEPPLISFDKDSKIINNGKTYVKKEGEYIIDRNARFRKPLTWEDFLLSDNLEKSDYNFNYYYNKNKDCEVDESKIKENFLNGYEYAREEIVFLYKQRLKKLKIYIEKLNLYQRLYLSKKILPPVITPVIKPIEINNKNLLISQEEYTIVKEARFNPLYKNWLNFIVNNKSKIINKKQGN